MENFAVRLFFSSFRGPEKMPRFRQGYRRQEEIIQLISGKIQGMRKAGPMLKRHFSPLGKGKKNSSSERENARERKTSTGDLKVGFF